MILNVFYDELFKCIYLHIFLCYVSFCFISAAAVAMEKFYLFFKFPLEQFKKSYILRKKILKLFDGTSVSKMICFFFFFNLQ